MFRVSVEQSSTNGHKRKIYFQLFCRRVLTRRETLCYKLCSEFEPGHTVPRQPEAKGSGRARSKGARRGQGQPGFNLGFRPRSGDGFPRGKGKGTWDPAFERERKGGDGVKLLGRLRGDFHPRAGFPADYVRRRGASCQPVKPGHCVASAGQRCRGDRVPADDQPSQKRAGQQAGGERFVIHGRQCARFPRRTQSGKQVAE